MWPIYSLYLFVQAESVFYCFHGGDYTQDLFVAQIIFENDFF